MYAVPDQTVHLHLNSSATNVVKRLVEPIKTTGQNITAEIGLRVFHWQLVFLKIIN